jgi:hypothetical protein
VSDLYADFLAAKAIIDPSTGLDNVPPLNAALFPFQRDITAWALRRGRAALFEGTGLGKSLQELVWADTVFRETGRPILHLAPLAVTAQMVREADKFNIAVRQVRDQAGTILGNNITNYQKIEHFDLSQFGGVILDESSILKSTDGHYRTRLIEECARIPFRLAATATPAPNDFMELGNHTEFLGVMSYTDMLATFFTHDGGDTQKWRLKGHAENEFWRWMASWAVMLRKPSDLGYSDEGYNLPPLRLHQHTVGIDQQAANDAGFLFAMPAQSLSERIKARRDTVKERVEAAVALTPTDQPCVWWCNLNSESELLTSMIPGAVETKGSDSDEEKERKLLGFSDGSIRTLITKPKVAGFGMNWQHCHTTGFVGLNDSWEQYYQAVRRFWRFGQTQAVDAHLIAAETEGNVVSNLRRKEADADRMMAAMIEHTADLSSEAVRGSVRDRPDYNPQKKMELPQWL